MQETKLTRAPGRETKAQESERKERSQRTPRRPLPPPPGRSALLALAHPCTTKQVHGCTWHVTRDSSMEKSRIPSPPVMAKKDAVGARREAPPADSPLLNPSSDADDNEVSGDEEHVEETAEATTDGPPTKKHKKQLTAHDVQIARETAELFKSNIFKLQIDELIKEVSIKDSHISKIEKVLHRLHLCIAEVESVEGLTLAQAESAVDRKIVAIPFPDPNPTKVNYSFSYLPPDNVALVGSFGLKTGITQQAGLSIDIALTMPLTILQPKDFLNYRAFYKRSFYLAYLAHQLIPITKKNHLPVKITYSFLNDDPLCPMLRLESIHTDNKDDLSFYKTKFSVNLLVAFPTGFFDAKKLLPDRNCIRIQTDETDLPPTPHYNSSLLASTAFDHYLKFLYASKKQAEAFKDACRLGRLWLQQRGFGSAISKGGFGHFEFAVLLAALLNGGGSEGTKLLLQGFSCYQLFKGAIKYLATQDLSSGYLTFQSDVSEGLSARYKKDGFGTPTMFDKTLKLNVLWKMTNSSYEALRAQAQTTFELLNDTVFDRFDTILLKKLHLGSLSYDLVYDLMVPDEVANSYGAVEKIAFITFDSYFRSKLYSLLRTALGDRATIIAMHNKKVNSLFPLTKRKPGSQFSAEYSLGLELNGDEADKLVTKGPLDSDLENAAKFREFWGPKASLRRFKDGTIQHCVVWTPVKNESVITQILEYVLSTHFNFQSGMIQRTEHLFNAKLPAPLTAGHSITSSANFGALRASLEDLNKVLSNLELPLSIKSLLPTSSGYRGTSILQPVPFAVSNPDFWNDVVLQFESSTRWPDELSALEKTKAAFLLRISESLNSETTYRTFLTSDSSIPFNDDVALLNILTPHGFGFRVRVLTERDEVLYLRAVANSGTQKALVQKIYLKFNQKYIGAIKHTRTVSILSTSFPYYSPLVRLFKQWLDAHTLLHHYGDELVELIALKPFVDSLPYSVPNSVEKGFLQILEYVASWNWKEDPLILDLVKRSDSQDDVDAKLSDKMTIQAYQVIQSNFSTIRRADPMGSKTQFFVGSRDDPSGILWSNDVTLPVATRLTALARAATELIKTQGINETTVELLFTPVFSDFDFTIKLKNSHLLKTSGVVLEGGFKNLNLGLVSYPDDIPSKYDLGPVLVDELQSKFGNTIVFSTRRCPMLFPESLNVVCGVFIPSTLSKKKFRVTLGLDVEPVGDDDEVQLNKQDVLDQIKLVGGDLIKSIKFRKN